jgi:hypothetical protein
MGPVILQDIGTEDAVRKAVANSAAATVANSAAAKSTFPKLSRPPHLQGEALSAWKRYIEPLNLDASREPCALVLVEFWSQFRADPKSFRSSKHSQMRAYWSVLMDIRVVKEAKPDEHFAND